MRLISLPAILGLIVLALAVSVAVYSEAERSRSSIERLLSATEPAISQALLKSNFISLQETAQALVASNVDSIEIVDVNSENESRLVWSYPNLIEMRKVCLVQVDSKVQHQGLQVGAISACFGPTGILQRALLSTSALVFFFILSGVILASGAVANLRFKRKVLELSSRLEAWGQSAVSGANTPELTLGRSDVEKRLSGHTKRLVEEIVDTRLQAREHEAIARTTQLLAHDVRKPFSILKLLLDSLQMPMPEDEKEEFLKEGMQEVDSAIASVNGFLEDLMTVGAEEFNLECEEIEVKSLVEECLREQARVHPKADIDVSLVLFETDSIFVDRSKIRRVLSNLIINAIQAMSQKGKLELKAEQSGRFTKITVNNYGSYIPAEVRKRIFETFFTAGKKGGTGLGLAIAKKWVEAHGGSIACQSEEHQDSDRSFVSFSFSLPTRENNGKSEKVIETKSLRDYLPASLSSGRSASVEGSNIVDYQEALGIARESARNLGSLRVLLLEDEKPYSDGLRRLYGQLFDDASAFVATGSPSEFRQSLLSHRPDLVILDIDLKGSELNGLEVLRLEKNGLLNDVTICVHSNRADSSTTAEALSTGADFVFPKPMTISHFTKLTEAVLQRQGGTALAQASEKLKVAVIEDVLVFRRAWREKLKSDADVSLFKSSSQFLSSDSRLEYDVVVTDFHLGDGEPTGADLAEHLRENGFSGPIVLASGIDDVSGELKNVFTAFASKTELMTTSELRALRTLSRLLH